MVESAVSAVTRRYGLSHAALNALTVIEGNGGPLLTGEVAARMHITSGSVTSVLDTLAGKGFVVRSSDPGDRRRVLVDITPAAQRVLDECLPRIQQTADLLVAQLDDAQQHALLDALELVRRSIAQLPTDLPEPAPRRRPAMLTRH
jgi:DNA-binding MarR family transcriptional regulator